MFSTEWEPGVCKFLLKLTYSAGFDAGGCAVERRLRTAARQPKANWRYRLEENGQSLREWTPKERSRCGGTVSQMESPEARDVFLSIDYSWGGTAYAHVSQIRHA